MTGFMEKRGRMLVKMCMMRRRMKSCRMSWP
jgi:hypothetical protein